MVSLSDLQEVMRRNKPTIYVDDDGKMADEGTLQFVFLGFNYLSAFGLLVRPIGTAAERDKFTRARMIYSWLPKDPHWWPFKERQIVLV